MTRRAPHVFERFPYQLTWVGPGVRHPVCLVSGPRRARFVHPGGVERATSRVPGRGRLLAGLFDVRWPAGLEEQRSEIEARLLAFVDARNALAQAEATLAEDEDHEWFRGRAADGVPAGLLLCETCREFRGRCLAGGDAPRLVRVSCKCQTLRRCRRCRQLVRERTGGTWFFDPCSRGVWHVPAFVPTRHRCGAASGRNRTPAARATQNAATA
jgi:hypothetical protein